MALRRRSGVHARDDGFSHFAGAVLDVAVEIAFASTNRAPAGGDQPLRVSLLTRGPLSRLVAREYALSCERVQPFLCFANELLQLRLDARIPGEPQDGPQPPEAMGKPGFFILQIIT